ncbi:MULTISPECIES: helix-turn-helix domain-containing transcriptional regulator [Helicobacter]|uniref:helix-turn-helix domain-containing transcriptional regulator n=1 Tax=Helicobacter TaxID=209 RepID=UPI000CF12EA2|nr:MULTISPECIES: hypothetical protein [Helicobacter]BEG58248.1 hypothetical protein NHP21005_19360 [Helicobacter sp. NHP21005]BEG58266.1 hypothetical protein NHP21005_19540 [Helicobacter sp. NHP21005]
MAFKPFSVVKFLNTDEKRLSFLEAVLEDGDLAELKDALGVIAKSKNIDLPSFEGNALEFARVLKKLGFGLQSLNEMQKRNTA